ncbi:hypothetical protein OH76DRAFT_543977 [Lentinus brumalis]|uniref:Uncharacterized protein n=1 Tax=Lentinus brumalis TaxID=2498619 RepID=A0A371D9Q6_9APHY|nr:hypothetical protein OH76DRAFT_543977 [Polyporus brumalis]
MAFSGACRAREARTTCYLLPGCASPTGMASLHDHDQHSDRPPASGSSSDTFTFPSPSASSTFYNPFRVPRIRVGYPYAQHLASRLQAVRVTLGVPPYTLGIAASRPRCRKVV